MEVQGLPARRRLEAEVLIRVVRTLLGYFWINFGKGWPL